MITVEAKKRGILSGQDITARLAELFRELESVQGEKTLIFEKGIYHLSSAASEKCLLFITNSVGDKEWFEGEEQHRSAAAMHLKGISDLTVEGNGATFLLDGQAVNIAVEYCKNIKLNNFILDTVSPDLHELKVIKKGHFFIDYELDRETNCVCENGQFYFKGTDYKVPLFKGKLTAYWNSRIPHDNPDSFSRVAHPFRTAIKLKEIGERKIRAYYTIKNKCELSDRFYIFDVRRKWSGIFLNSCENITISRVEQRFNYALGLVGQDCDTVTVDNVRFAPAEDGARAMASIADFMHFCMCRGKITVKDSYFKGSSDDCLNVHGIHFRIVNKTGNQITVRFMHPQTHGFNPLRVGDKITYVDSASLLCKGEAKIIESKLINEYDILLTLDDASGAEEGLFTEDISATADVDFINNTLTRITTRGLLLTTRGKVVIKGNKFINNTMNNILVSDDAKNWYESGCVRNILIEDNEFGDCPENTVCVKPENSIHKGAVHSGIIIRNNKIKKPVFYFKSSEGIVLENNVYGKEPVIKNINAKVTIK